MAKRQPGTRHATQILLECPAVSSCLDARSKSQTNSGEDIAMRVIGLSGLTQAAVLAELACGGRFVYYEYCISLIFLTFRRGSRVYLLRGSDAGIGKRLGYTVVSVLLGWWGLPWGFILTPLTVITNLMGGKDVTETVLAQLKVEQPDFM
jgi:hypothetical protein